MDEETEEESVVQIICALSKGDVVITVFFIERVLWVLLALCLWRVEWRIVYIIIISLLRKRICDSRDELKETLVRRIDMMRQEVFAIGREKLIAVECMLSVYL